MRKTEKLSERQRNILRFMERYFLNNGFPPTIREIGEATGINSTSVVNYNLNKLVRMGYLQRTATLSRGLRLVKTASGTPFVAAPNGKSAIKPAEALRVGLYGQIVAGEPVPVPDDITPHDDEAVEVTPMQLGGVDPSEVFALRVKGDSMVDAMIQDGDIVILRKTNTVRNGDMVAVWLQERGETTLKYFYHEEGDRVRLQPAHPMMDPIYVSAKGCQVQGRVVSVIRMLR
jgi:repressor LexA